MSSFTCLIYSVGSLAVPRQDRISSSLCQMIKVSSSFADVEHVMVNISRTPDLHMKSMEVMPNVQKLLADHGTTYNKHFCTNALCCPSRVNILTGKAVQ